MKNTTIIITHNKTQQSINQIYFKKFTKVCNQKIYIFPAEHLHVTDFTLIWAEIFSKSDGNEWNSAELLYYTQEMKEVILFNICTAAGIVNDICNIVVKVIINLKNTLHTTLYSYVNFYKQHFMTLTTCIAFVFNLF